VTVRFLQIAEIELDEAMQWYESQAPGLGEAFLIEVLSAVNRVSLYPEAWRPLDEEVRRCPNAPSTRLCYAPCCVPCASVARSMSSINP
jgi:hypothetical protein